MPSLPLGKPDAPVQPRRLCGGPVLQALARCSCPLASLDAAFQSPPFRAAISAVVLACRYAGQRRSKASGGRPQVVQVGFCDVGHLPFACFPLQVVQAPRSVHTARRWLILPHWVGLALGSSTGSRIPQSSTCWGRVLSKRSFLPPLKTRVSVIGAADSWPPGCVHSWPGSEGGPLPGFPAEEHAGGSRL